MADNFSGNTGNRGNQGNPNNGFNSNYYDNVDILRSSNYQSRREAVGMSNRILSAQRGETNFDDEIRKAAGLEDHFKSINNLQRATITNLNQQNVIMQTMLQSQDEKSRKSLEKQLKLTEQAYKDEIQHYEDFRRANSRGFTEDEKSQMDEMLKGTKQMYAESAEAFKQTFGDAYKDVFDKARVEQKKQFAQMATSFSDLFQNLFINGQLGKITGSISDLARNATKSQQSMRNNTGWTESQTNSLDNRGGRIQGQMNNKYSREEIQSMMNTVQGGTHNTNTRQVAGITKSLIAENSSNPQAVGAIMDMVQGDQTKGGNPVGTARTWTNVERGLRRSGITGVNSTAAIQNASQNRDMFLSANGGNSKRAQRAEKNSVVNSSVATAVMGNRGQGLMQLINQAATGDWSAINSLQSVGVTTDMLDDYKKNGDPSKILSAFSSNIKRFGSDTATMKSTLGAMGINLSDSDISGLQKFNISDYNKQRSSAMSNVNSSIKNNSAVRDITRNNDARNGNIFSGIRNMFSNSALAKSMGWFQNKSGITMDDMFKSVNKILLWVRAIATSDLLSKMSVAKFKSIFGRFNPFSKGGRHSAGRGGGSGSSGGSAGDLLDDLDDILGDTSKEGKTAEEAAKGGSKIGNLFRRGKSGIAGLFKTGRHGSSTLSRLFRGGRHGKSIFSSLFRGGSKTASSINKANSVVSGAAKVGKTGKLLKHIPGLGAVLTLGGAAMDLGSGMSVGDTALDSTIGRGHGLFSKDSAGNKAMDIAGGAATGAAIGSFIPVIGTGVGAVIGGGLSAIGGSNIKKGAGSAWRFTKKAASSSWKGAKKLTRSLGRGTERVFNKVLTSLKKTVSKVITYIPRKFKAMIRSITRFGGGLKKWWSGLFGGNSKKKYSKNGSKEKGDIVRNYKKGIQNMSWSDKQSLGFNNMFSNRDLNKGLDPSIQHSHRQGLNRVPYDGYSAVLHKGEVVVPSSKIKTYNQLKKENAAKLSLLKLKTEKEDREKLKKKSHSEKGRSGTLATAKSISKKSKRGAKVTPTKRNKLSNKTSNKVISNKYDWATSTNKRGDSYNFSNKLEDNNEYLSQDKFTQMGRTLAGVSGGGFLENLFRHAKFDSNAFDIPDDGSGKDNDGGGETLSGNSNTEKTWNYLRKNGFSRAAAAGAVGNMIQESGLNPRKWNGGVIDDYSPSAKHGDGGFGIIQWTFGRRPKMGNKVKSWKMSPNSLSGQLRYLLYELGSGYHSWGGMAKSDNVSFNQYKKLSSPKKASNSWLYDVEGGGDSSDGARAAYAQKIYNKYKKYKQGTPWIPDDQIALLHKGEAVIPANHNPYTSSGTPKKKSGVITKQSNDDVVEAIKWAVKVLASAIESTSSSNNHWSNNSKKSLGNSNFMNGEGLDYGYRF